MRCYLAGRALRDELLDVPVVRREWVVIGATREGLVGAGFRPDPLDPPGAWHTGRPCPTDGFPFRYSMLVSSAWTASADWHGAGL